jgi:hypothetical protein
LLADNLTELDPIKRERFQLEHNIVFNKVNARDNE